MTPSGSWSRADDVRDREPAAGAQHARSFAEDGRLVGREVDHAVRDHDVDGCILDGESLDVCLAELDLPEPRAAGERGRLLELCVGHVDPDHPAAAADLAGGEEAVHARSAPEIDHRLAGADLGEVEVVTDPGERVDRLGRDVVELRRLVAEPLRELATRLEVELPLRVLGDLAVHLLHPALQLLRVERLCARGHLNPPVVRCSGLSIRGAGDKRFPPVRQVCSHRTSAP